MSARPPSLRARLRKRSHDARDASSSSSERGPRSITGRVICWTDVRNVELPFKLPFPILIGRIPSIAPSRPRGSCDSTDRRRDQRDSFLQYIFRMYAKYIVFFIETERISRARNLLISGGTCVTKNILEFDGGLIYVFFRGLHVFANGILIDVEVEQLEIPGEGGGRGPSLPSVCRHFPLVLFDSSLRVLRIYMSTIVCSNEPARCGHTPMLYTRSSVCPCVCVRGARLRTSGFRILA